MGIQRAIVTNKKKKKKIKTPPHNLLSNDRVSDFRIRQLFVFSPLFFFFVVLFLGNFFLF